MNWSKLPSVLMTNWAKNLSAIATVHHLRMMTKALTDLALNTNSSSEEKNTSWIHFKYAILFRPLRFT